MSIGNEYILMLEDDPDDRYLTSSVLETLDVSVGIKFIGDSENLYISLAEKEPLLILIDYNVNPENGLEILKKLKTDIRYKHIPVVLLGDTNDPDFIKQCYCHGANTYAIKPTTFEATKNRIGLFFNYWLQVAETGQPVKNPVFE